MLTWCDGKNERMTNTVKTWDLLSKILTHCVVGSPFGKQVQSNYPCVEKFVIKIKKNVGELQLQTK